MGLYCFAVLRPCWLMVWRYVVRHCFNSKMEFVLHLKISTCIKYASIVFKIYCGLVPNQRFISQVDSFLMLNLVNREWGVPLQFYVTITTSTVLRLPWQPVHYYITMVTIIVLSIVTMVTPVKYYVAFVTSTVLRYHSNQHSTSYLP